MGSFLNLFAAGGEKVLSLAGKDHSTIYQWFIVATYLNCLDSSSLCDLADLIACVSRWRTWQRVELGKCLNQLSESSESDCQSCEVRHSLGRLVSELRRYNSFGAGFTGESNGDDAQSVHHLTAFKDKDVKDAKA